MLRKFMMGACALALAACGNNAPDADYDAYADPSPEDAPALWAVSDDDNTVYLFGTFHLLPDETDWRRPAFEQALAETGITYVEADAESPEAVARIAELVQTHGRNPEGVTLSSILGPERAASFDAIASNYNIPISWLEEFQPWLAILTVTQAAYAAAGLNPAAGVEPAVLAIARSQDDEIAYLETAEMQILALAGLDVEELLASFDVGLSQLGELETQILEGVEAWRVGDLETLDTLLLAETREIAPGAYDLIFTERNANWTEQIKVMMDGDQDQFLAVGAGHLIGDDSVIDMLLKEGYKPVRLQ